MLSKSTKAEAVRTYYIELETLIIRYKDQMLEGMQAEIQRMAINQKPKNPNDNAGYVYVFRASHTKNSVYKLGRTSNLVKRLVNYHTGHADDDIDLVFKHRTDNHKVVETCVKAMLKEKQYRKYKEIYEVDINIIKRLVKECDGVATIKTELLRRKSTQHVGIS